MVAIIDGNNFNNISYEYNIILTVDIERNLQEILDKAVKESWEEGLINTEYLFFSPAEKRSMHSTNWRCQ